MKPSTALESKLAEVRELISSSSTRNPRVFGSVLHGTDTEGSDVDILVDALPGTTLFDLGDLHAGLEEILGVPVSLLTPAELPLGFRDRVLSEARAI